MVHLPGEYLNQSIRKGFRSHYEAMKDQKFLVMNESTGVQWEWRNKRGDICSFSY